MFSRKAEDVRNDPFFKPRRGYRAGHFFRCGAAEIQHVAENAPRWADVSESIAPFPCRLRRLRRDFSRCLRADVVGNRRGQKNTTHQYRLLRGCLTEKIADKIGEPSHTSTVEQVDDCWVAQH